MKAKPSVDFGWYRRPPRHTISARSLQVRISSFTILFKSYVLEDAVPHLDQSDQETLDEYLTIVLSKFKNNDLSLRVTKDELEEAISTAFSDPSSLKAYLRGVIENLSDYN